MNIYRCEIQVYFRNVFLYDDCVVCCCLSSDDEDAYCDDCSTAIEQREANFLNYEFGEIFVKTYLKKDDGDIVLYLSYSGDNSETEKYHICNESSLGKVKGLLANGNILYVNVKANIRKLRESLAQEDKHFTNEVEILEIDIHKQ